MNTVNLIGNLTKDCELRYIPSGTAVADISIAVNEIQKGEKIAHFFQVTTWGKTAENCNQYLKKGSKVAVTGSLQQQRWQTQEGKNRSKVTINARRVDFLDTKPKEESQEEDFNYNS